MSDFIAQIQAQLDLSSAKSQLDSFIKQCESQKIKFQIDPTSLNTGTLSKQMQDQIKALSKNLSVSKFTPDIIDYAKMKKKSQEEIEKISETMYKGLYGANGSNKSTTKWANQYTSDAKKMAQIAAKQQEDVAKTIGNIQKKVTTGNYSATASKNESQLMKYIGIDSDTLSQARKYATEYQNIISDLTKHFDTKNAFKLDDSQIVQMGQRLETLGTTFKNTMTQISNDPSMNLTKNIDTYATKFNEIQAKFQTLQSSFNKSGTNELGAAGYEKVNALIVQATTAQAKFNAELQKGNSANLDNLNADMREFNSIAQKATTEYAKLMSPASAIKQQTLLDQMNVWAKANPRAIKAGASQWEGMLNSLSGKTLTVGQLNDVTSQVKNYK